MKLGIVLSILLFSLAGICQENSFINLNSKNGLPTNEVYDIYIDTKGFLWLATDNGLYQYDGFKYTNYTNTAMTSKAGSYIKEDKWGKIWYQNFDGNLFFIKNDSLHQYGTANYTNDFFLYENKIITSQKQSGLTLYTINTNKVQYITTSQSDFTFAQSDSLLFLMNDRVSVYNQKGELKDTISLMQGHTPFKVLYIEGKYYIIEIGANDFILTVSDGKQRRILYKENKQPVLQNVIYINGEIWICTRNGIIKYLISKNTTEEVYKHQNVSKVVVDKNNNYWISTLENGIYIIPNFKIKKHPIASQNARLQIIDNNLWTYDKKGEIRIYDPNNMQLKYSKSYTSNNEIYGITPLGTAYINPNIKNLNTIQYNNHNYSIALSGQKSIQYLDEKYLSMAISGAALLVKYRENKIVSAWENLFNKRIDTVAGIGYKQQAYIAPYVKSKSTIYLLNTKTIYYSTNDGLYKATPDSVSEVLANQKKIYGTTLAKYNTSALLFLNSGQIMLLNNEPSTQIPSDINQFSPYRFFKVKDSILFLANEKYIYRVNLNNYINLHQLNWEQIPFFLNTSELIDIDLYNNQYIFSLPQQLLFSPVVDKKQNNIIPFYITTIQTNKSTYYNFDKLNFSTTEKNITINYAVLNYLNENYSLDYSINNDNWKRLNNTSRQLTLASLSPGNYSISFRLNNKIQPQSISFTINKPWYASWWFYLLLLACSMLFIYLLFKRRILINKKENELLIEKEKLEKELQQSKLSSIKSQMNPHFLFNALNTIQSFIINEDKKNASSYLSKFSKLTRRILEMSEQETIPLSEEIEAIKLYLDLEKMRFEDFTYCILVANNIDTTHIKIPSMLIQPYLENAIKHGLLHKLGAKNLILEFKIDTSILTIMIDDNGVGRTRSAQINTNKKTNHQSFSTKANMKRLELLNKENNSLGEKIIDKYNNANEPLGTTVILNIPTNL